MCSALVQTISQLEHLIIQALQKKKQSVQVYGLNYVINKLESEDSLLIVDDVHDTGLSIDQIIKNLRKACKKNTPEIKVATPYFKPKNNETNRTPDYFLHETDRWLVFPHELEGLSIEAVSYTHLTLPTICSV